MKTEYHKYPRTPHLSWSPGASKDDVYLVDASGLEGHEIIVTEKMDGENTSLYHDGFHARSLDSRHHPSRDWVKAMHAGIAQQIPQQWRLCGENVYAQHSVLYDNLESYFYLFSIWNEENVCLSWHDTEEWAALLGLTIPAVLYKGLWDEAAIKEIKIDPKKSEGYVVRLTDAFHYDDFGRSLGKWVRPHHVQTDQHWMYAPVIPNKLAK